ncbi:hypothetical protein BD560DRAFT_390597 [Blakeslea trispora]|nr:hypothetical protein BD560DRAFT_390597 [Blakeslea trispora]
MTQLKQFRSVNCIFHTSNLGGAIKARGHPKYLPSPRLYVTYSSPFFFFRQTKKNGRVCS